MADAICIGDLLIDFVPTVTGTGLADAPAFVKAPGGAAANVAVGLARLGVPQRPDGQGRRRPVRPFPGQDAGDEGVDVDPLRFEPRARTALAFVSLAADGEREFLFYRHPSADLLFRPTRSTTTPSRAASVFHFDSISLAAEQPRATALHAADVAAGRRPADLVRRQSSAALWPDADAAKDGIRQGLARATSSSSATTSWTS